MSSASGRKPIESPMARYSATGQLSCIVCNQVIKTESLWTAHINSKQHIDNKAKLKQSLLSEQHKSKPSQNGTTATAVSSKTDEFKRPSAVKSKEDPAVVNAALKRPHTSVPNEASKKQRLENLITQTDSIALNAPDVVVQQMEVTVAPIVIPEAEPVVEEPPLVVANALISSALPEGFFDDTELDDKMRGVSRVKDLEAEYAEFKKIMQMEDVKAEQIVEQDDTLRDVDRDLVEVDEQIERWQKVERMHVRREAILAKVKMRKEAAGCPMTTDAQDSSDESDADVDLDSVLTLTMRSKNRC